MPENVVKEPYKGILKITLDYPFHFHIFASDLNNSR